MLPDSIRNRLRLPLIAAPMFLVSGPALVIAACRAGMIGSFPTANCRTIAELDAWLAEIKAATEGVAPFCPNLIVHRSNPRVAEDVRVLLRHAPRVVITSVGSPAGVVAPLHDAGALVLADVATLRHAERALEAGADGLVLLTAGAGGQTGWLNPFVFVRAVAWASGKCAVTGTYRQRSSAKAAHFTASFSVMSTGNWSPKSKPSLAR